MVLDIATLSVNIYAWKDINNNILTMQHSTCMSRTGKLFHSHGCNNTTNFSSFIVRKECKQLLRMRSTCGSFL